MVSHSEVPFGKTNGHAGTPKPRSRKSTKSQKPEYKINAHQAQKQLVSETGGTDVVPVMKLRAIDLVDASQKPGAKPAIRPAQEKTGIPDVLHMPAPDTMTAAEQNLVTDPELLELLQQLSETIDTANTVLEAAGPESLPQGAPTDETFMAHGGEQVERPAPPPNPQSPLPDEEELPLAAMASANQSGQPPLQPKNRFGFGLFLNAALAGLVLTAGAAWIVHTNPWLLDRSVAGSDAQTEMAMLSEPSKDQSSLTKPEPKQPAIKKTAAAPVLASLAPPPAEPVPMEAAAITPAKLKIDESSGPIRAQAGQGVALNVALTPGSGSPETSVMVQGVPGDAKLSNGKNLGSGNWLLNENQLGDLKLETGTSLKPGEHVIEFIVVRSDGSVPETRKVRVMVDGPSESASAATSPQASAIPVATANATSVARQTDVQQVEATAETQLPALSPAEVKALLTRGTNLLEEGDVSGARLLLEYAAQRGSKEAMIKLAQSYDPDHLLKLAVHGVRPDAKLSALWYGRAEGGQQ